MGRTRIFCPFCQNGTYSQRWYLQHPSVNFFTSRKCIEIDGLGMNLWRLARSLLYGAAKE